MVELARQSPAKAVACTAISAKIPSTLAPAVGPDYLSGPTMPRRHLTVLDPAQLAGSRKPGAVEIDDDHFHDECGVFAVYGHSESANIAYLGLHALQHRG